MIFFDILYQSVNYELWTLKFWGIILSFYGVKGHVGHVEGYQKVTTEKKGRNNS